MTSWTVAHQAPLSMGFPSQEYWSGLPFPPPGHLLDPGIEPTSPALAGRFFTTEPAGKCVHAVDMNARVSIKHQPSDNKVRLILAEMTV